MQLVKCSSVRLRRAVQWIGVTPTDRHAKLCLLGILWWMQPSWREALLHYYIHPPVSTPLLSCHLLLLVVRFYYSTFVNNAVFAVFRPFLFLTKAPAPQRKASTTHLAKPFLHWSRKRPTGQWPAHPGFQQGASALLPFSLASLPLVCTIVLYSSPFHGGRSPCPLLQ